MGCLGLVDSKAETTDGTITHNLVLPRTVVFLETILEHLWTVPVYANANGIALAFVEWPEGNSVDYKTDAIGRHLWKLVGGRSQLHDLSVIDKAADQLSIAALVDELFQRNDIVTFCLRLSGS